MVVLFAPQFEVDGPHLYGPRLEVVRGTLVSTRAAPGRMNFDVSNLLLEFLSGLRQLIEEALGW